MTNSFYLPINQLFTRLENWEFETFEPETGIIEPTSKAYIIELDIPNSKEKWRYPALEALLNHPCTQEIEALVCRIRYNYWEKDRYFGICLETLCDASNNLPNLKALYIGDIEEHEYRKSKLQVFDVRPILEAFPKLQVLQVRGRFDEFTLECQYLQHDYLKTLIIETADLGYQNMEQICNLSLPALEYFQLWLGRRFWCTSRLLEVLTQVPSFKSFPNLSYLGLRSSEDANLIAEYITKSSLINQLTGLDLSMGTLTDYGAELLLNCPAVNQLYMLDVSRNQLSDTMIQKLYQLNCQVIAEPQDSDYYRYSALYE
jgi:hypothetical protein